jgi:hypothetical protein
MYFAVVALLLFILPAASIGLEAGLSPHAASIMALTGKWYVFWAGGVRLLLAGIRQVSQPSFTAAEIFEIHDPKAFAIVREIGFGNLSMGTLALCTIFQAGWIVPAALVTGLYYGFAGLGHVGRGKRNRKESVAMVSDAFAFLVLLAVVASSFNHAAG